VPTIGLVACVDAKEGPHVARDLYTSDWFKKARAYLDRLVELGELDDWAILSAKHGLLLQGKKIKPYDQTLKGARKADKEAWAARAYGQIVDTYPPGTHFVVLAGKDYREFLFPPGAPFTYEVPMEGLFIGQQKRWLNEELARLSSSRGFVLPACLQRRKGRP